MEAVKRTGIIIFDFNLHMKMNHLVSFSLFLTMGNFQWVKNNHDLYLQWQDKILTVRSWIQRSSFKNLEYRRKGRMNVIRLDIKRPKTI